MGKCIVIGGANIDIFGIAKNPLIKEDSNIGKVEMSFGGVGRNIAHNMAILNTDLYFMSIFSTDNFGKLLYQDCERLNFNLKYSKIVSEYKSSTYLAIINEKNDMEVAISDMEIINTLTVDDLKVALKDFYEDDLVVIDTNLSKELLSFILDNKHYKIAIDPISVNKANKLEGYLEKIDIFKPNVFEANALTNSTQYIDAAKKLIDDGVKELCLTLNSEGVLYYNKGSFYQLKVDEKINVVNATGAGDAFFASYLVQRLANKDIETSIKFALVYSILTLQSIDTVNEGINETKVNVMIDKLNFIKEKLC